MKLFDKLFRSDVRYGLGVAVAGRLVIVFLVSLLVFFLSYSLVLIKLPDIQGRLTFGELMLCMFRGMTPYSPQSGRPFLLPMGWLALLISILYVTADYPFRDLGGMGAHVIVACRSRWAWWLPKCCWVVVCVLACLVIITAMCATVTLALGGEWSFRVRTDVFLALNAGDVATMTGGNASSGRTGGLRADATDSADLGLAFLAFALPLVSIALVQLVAGLFAHPVIGLAVSIAQLIFSAFFKQWYLLGNYLMLARTGELMRGGMDPLVGCVLSLCTAAVAVLVGGLVFNHRDIIGRGGSAS